MKEKGKDKGMSVETVMAQHRQIESQVQSQTHPETQVYSNTGNTTEQDTPFIDRAGQEVMKSADSYQCHASLIDGVGEYLMFLG